MGMKLTHLRPIGGFCAETAGAIVLIGTSISGIPVSTTHTITGSIMGVGMVKRLTAVKWGVAGKIIWAWVLTIPATAVCSAIVYYIITLFL
jgi:PiT family inorganic phosphate transporter